MTKSNFKRNRPRNGKNGGNKKNHIQSRDRYLDKAKSALASGDRVGAENFFQHAEHYARMISEKEIADLDAANDDATAEENLQDAG